MLFAAIVLCAFGPLPVGDGPKDLGADFTLPEGLSVTLWAEAPMFFNPTAIDTDARGRIWVAEAVNYRKWRGRNPGLSHPDGDRIVILEDSDGDGAADRSSVFAQDKDLVAPLGLCVLDESRVLVSCSPNAFVYTDTDGDGRADKRELFLTGFGGPDHDHGLHSFVIGPDGRYYVAAGNAGPHLVRDADGFMLRSGSLYNDGGEVLADNKPGLISDDGRLWTGGLILRLDADGGGLSVRAHNFRNNYEVAVDAFGDLYTSDNDDDGSQACRALWVLPRSNNGYFSADGSRFWGADRRPGQELRRAHWHQDDPGVAPMGCILGAGGPTGVAVIEDGPLAERFEGWILAADAGASVVYGLAPKRAGAGMDLLLGDFLRSRARDGDGGKSQWFRPSDALVGSDGAVYVSDWYDPGVGGHAMGDREGYGRILRIAPRGSPTRPVAVALHDTEARLAALASPAVNLRGRAARALIADRGSIEPLLRFLHGPLVRSPRVLARAQWILAGLGQTLPGDVADRVTGAGMNVEFRARSVHASARIAMARFEDPWMRREVALTLESDASIYADEIWMALAESYDGKDRVYLEALGTAARGRESRVYARLIDGIVDPTTWDARLAGLVWRLHPPEAIDAWKARALSPALSAEARAQSIDALAFTNSRAAGEALLDVALTGPEDLRESARAWLRSRDSNDWSEWNLADQLGADDGGERRVLHASAGLEAGVQRIEVDLRGATRLYLTVDDGGDGNGCDWVDWVDGTWIGPEGETPLSEVKWRSAEAGWGQVRKDANCNGGPLSVGGKVHARGLGTHANSEIVFDLPPGRFERLVVTAGLDDQGLKQGCGSTVRVQVAVAIPPDPKRFEKLEARLVDEATPANERKAIARELCSTREGGLYALAAAHAGRWRGETRAWIAEAIFENPDLAVRALASESFPRAGGAAIGIAALERLSGDEKRGERLFFSEAGTCSKCHAVDGRGGDIGPDLSGVRTKYAPGALFDAILNPSAGIAFGYDTWMFEASDDRVITGFLLADGENVMVKDTAGVRTLIPRDEIVARRKIPVSAMPDNAVAGLSPQDLADVVRFLADDRQAPRQLGEPIALFNGVDLTGWTFHLDAPGAQASDVWSVSDGVLDCKGSPIGYLRTEAEYEDFVLELDWRFPAGGPPGNSGVLLRRVGADKVWPKSVEAQLHHRNAGDIWNIDEVPMQVDAARTSGRRTQMQAPCNEKAQGEWNHYKITLDRGDLTLEVNGEVQNRARWVERVAGHICLQSEGSRIQFRNVVLRKLE